MFAFACLHALPCTRLSAAARKHPCVLEEGPPLRSGFLADWLASLSGLRACLFACAVVPHILMQGSASSQLACWLTALEFNHWMSQSCSALAWVASMRLLAFACYQSRACIRLFVIACLHSLACVCSAFACLSSPVYIRMLVFAFLHSLACNRLLALAR